MLKKLNFNTEQSIQFFSFLFFAMTFLIRSGNGFGALALFLLTLVSAPLLYQHYKLQPLTGFEKGLFISLLVFALIPMLSAFNEGLSGSAYDKPARYIIASITFLLLLRFKVNLMSIALGAWLGAIFAGSNALYDVFYLDLPRAGGRFTVVIEFGDISLLLTGFVMLCYQKLKQKIPQVFIILSILLGFTAVILSQTRGAWLFIPFLLILVISHYRHTWGRFNKKRCIIFTTILVAIIAICAFSAGKMISERVKEIQSDIVLYQQGDSFTPVGLRFDMWKGGMQSIKNNPILGGGEEGIIIAKQQLNTQKLIHLPEDIIDWKSVHNQYLDTWAKYGIFALIALLGLFFIPLIFFIKQCKQNDKEARTASYCGISLCTGYLFFGLTESIFTINSTVMFYSFAIIIFFSCAKTIKV